jgi:hypothetical protein
VTQPADHSPLAADLLAALSHAADLDLSQARRDEIESLVTSSLAAANELSRRMADPRHDNLTPIVSFTAPNSGAAASR